MSQGLSNNRVAGSYVRLINTDQLFSSHRFYFFFFNGGCKVCMYLRSCLPLIASFPLFDSRLVVSFASFGRVESFAACLVPFGFTAAVCDDSASSSSTCRDFLDWFFDEGFDFDIEDVDVRLFTAELLEVRPATFGGLPTRRRAGGLGCAGTN